MKNIKNKKNDNNKKYIPNEIKIDFSLPEKKRKKQIKEYFKKCNKSFKKLVL